MAKIPKVRISATIRPDQREYIDRLAEELHMSFAEALVEVLDTGTRVRESSRGKRS